MTGWKRTRASAWRCTFGPPPALSSPTPTSCAIACRLRTWTERVCHMSYVICHMSYVICHDRCHVIAGTAPRYRACSRGGWGGGVGRGCIYVARSFAHANVNWWVSELVYLFAISRSSEFASRDHSRKAAEDHICTVCARVCICVRERKERQKERACARESPAVNTYFHGLLTL